MHAFLSFRKNLIRSIDRVHNLRLNEAKFLVLVYLTEISLVFYKLWLFEKCVRSESTFAVILSRC